MARFGSRPLDCSLYARLPTTATPDVVGQAGFVHDQYATSFEGSFETASEALLRYRVFDPARMLARVCTEDGLVAEGATIVQRVRIGPASLETAVRVVGVQRSDERVGFSYVTVRGHPEQGLASFAVLRVPGGGRIEAEAWSKPGSLLTLLGRPIARRLQRRFTREALASLHERALRSQ